MPLFYILLIFLSYIQYIHTFLRPWTFAKAPLHSFIAEQLSGRHLPLIFTLYKMMFRLDWKFFF